MNRFLLSFFQVEEVFSRSIESLCSPENVRYTRYRSRSGYTLPVYLGGVYRIWGLSAIILHMTLLALVPPPLYNFKLQHRWYLSCLGFSLHFFGIFESYRRLNTKLRTVTVGSIVDESEEGINMCWYTFSKKWEHLYCLNSNVLSQRTLVDVSYLEIYPQYCGYDVQIHRMRETTAFYLSTYL